jgi:hypothetical protein
MSMIVIDTPLQPDDVAGAEMVMPCRCSIARKSVAVLPLRACR